MDCAQEKGGACVDGGAVGPKAGVASMGRGPRRRGEEIGVIVREKEEKGVYYVRCKEIT